MFYIADLIYDVFLPLHLFNGPKSTAIAALVTLMRDGDDLPDAQEAAYNELYKKADHSHVFRAIKRLSTTWLDPESRYMGIALLSDLAENSNQPRVVRKCRRTLKRLLRRETNPRNKALLEQVALTSPTIGLLKRLGRHAIASDVKNIFNHSA